VEIILIIPPCQYASGREVDVARSFPEIKYVLGPGDYIKYIFLRKSFPFISENKKKNGVCVFLGGDPFHAVLVSRKLKLPAVAYMQKPRWRNRFEKFMVLNEEIKNKNFLKEGIASDKVVVVGDLMVDSVRLQMENGENQTSRYSFLERPLISIIPGSRLKIAQNMTLFFLKVCELIKENFPQASFFLVLSPFLKKEDFFNLDEAEIYKVFDDIPRVKLSQERECYKIITSAGLNVDIITAYRYKIMSSSDLALTIPGTNTAELACLGVAMLVVLPLQRPEVIPLDGLAGLVGKFPYLGVFIKRYIIKEYNKRTKFCAIPNIRAGRKIVPELRGKVSPQDVASKAKGLLQNREKRESISKELKEVMGKEGAARRATEVVLQVGEQIGTKKAV